MYKFSLFFRDPAIGCRFRNYSKVFFLTVYMGFHISLSGQTAIGGITPATSSMLDVQSTSKGMLMPRMTTDQRSAISSPATGLMIFNTTIRCLEINMGIPSSPLWQKIKCISCGAYVAVGEWKEFMCYNLGANTDADPFTPSWEINGDYYQWGRIAVAAGGPTDAMTPNDGAVAGWDTNGAADGSWADAPAAKTANDPCPSGFRVPTKDQFDGVLDPSLNPQSVPAGASWASGVNNYNSGRNVGPALFLPAAGFRSSSDGSLAFRNQVGYYWSSTIFAPLFYRLTVQSGSVTVQFAVRANGYSVRCIAE
jgi:uncharacterized protein (TIGR02145 family)